MLEIVVFVLVVLWLLGLVTATTMGGFIHGLLIVAIAMIAVRFLQSRGV